MLMEGETEDRIRQLLGSLPLFAASMQETVAIVRFHLIEASVRVDGGDVSGARFPIAQNRYAPARGLDAFRCPGFVECRDRFGLGR